MKITALTNAYQRTKLQRKRNCKSNFPNASRFTITESFQGNSQASILFHLPIHKKHFYYLFGLKSSVCQLINLTDRNSITLNFLRYCLSVALPFCACKTDGLPGIFATELLVAIAGPECHLSPAKYKSYKFKDNILT